MRHNRPWKTDPTSIRAPLLGDAAGLSGAGVLMRAKSLKMATGLEVLSRNALLPL